MREAEYKKPINTIPDGVWESSGPQKNKTTQTQTSDLQGNGYPMKQLKNQNINADDKRKKE